MGSRNVRLDEDVYKRIEAYKREDESFSDAIDRLTSDYSLLDFAGGYTEADAAHHRELLERSERTATADHEEMLERLNIDPG